MDKFLAVRTERGCCILGFWRTMGWGVGIMDKTGMPVLFCWFGYALRTRGLGLQTGNAELKKLQIAHCCNNHPC